MTCPYVNHVREFKEVPWLKGETRVMPCHTYYCCSKIGCIMEDEYMKNISRLPKFMPGQVIDISYKNGNGLPNRLLVKMVFIRECDKDWGYKVLSESTMNEHYLIEQDICNGMINKYAQVYNCKEVMELYNDGWRFCGNYDKNSAETIGAKYALIGNIKNIILRPALDASGSPLPDKYGIWIKYKNTINSDGTVIEMYKDSDVIVIK